MPAANTDPETRSAIVTARKRHLAELEKWTWDDLVAEYPVSRSTIRRILKEEGLIGLERGDVDPETLEIQPGAGKANSEPRNHANSEPNSSADDEPTPEDTAESEGSTVESGDGLTEYASPEGSSRAVSAESGGPTGESGSMNEESDDHAEEEEEPAPDGGREDDVVDVVECSCGAQLGLEPGDGPTVTCPSCSSTIPVGDDVGVCSSCEAVLEIEATDPGRISCPACGAQQVRA